MQVSPSSTVISTRRFRSRCAFDTSLCATSCAISCRNAGQEARDRRSVIGAPHCDQGRSSSDQVRDCAGFKHLLSASLRRTNPCTVVDRVSETHRTRHALPLARSREPVRVEHGAKPEPTHFKAVRLSIRAVPAFARSHRRRRSINVRNASALRRSCAPPTLVARHVNVSTASDTSSRSVRFSAEEGGVV